MSYCDYTFGILGLIGNPFSIAFHVHVHLYFHSDTYSFSHTASSIFLFLFLFLFHDYFHITPSCRLSICLVIMNSAYHSSNESRISFHIFTILIYIHDLFYFFLFLSLSLLPVPPNEVTISEVATGKRANSLLGPYPEGSRLQLSCSASGGRCWV